jgi:hypothetical protein
VISTSPRRLSTEEAALLTHLLRADHLGFDALREQIQHAHVTSQWFEGSLSFDLQVTPGTLRAPIPDGPCADTQWAWNPEGQPIGHFTVWVDDGQLSALEYAWVTDQMPSQYPELSAVREPEPSQ